MSLSRSRCVCKVDDHFHSHSLILGLDSRFLREIGVLADDFDIPKATMSSAADSSLSHCAIASNACSNNFASELEEGCLSNMKEYGRSSSMSRVSKPRIQRTFSDTLDIPRRWESSSLPDNSSTMSLEDLEISTREAKLQIRKNEKREQALRKKFDERPPGQEPRLGGLKEHAVHVKNDYVKKPLSVSKRETECHIGSKFDIELAMRGEDEQLSSVERQSETSFHQRFKSFDGSRFNPIEEAFFALNSPTTIQKHGKYVSKYLESALNFNELQSVKEFPVMPEESFAGECHHFGDLDLISDMFPMDSYESSSEKCFTTTSEESTSDYKGTNYKSWNCFYNCDKCSWNGEKFCSCQHEDSDSVSYVSTQRLNDPCLEKSSEDLKVAQHKSLEMGEATRNRMGIERSSEQIDTGLKPHLASGRGEEHAIWPAPSSYSNLNESSESLSDTSCNTKYGQSRDLDGTQICIRFSEIATVVSLPKIDITQEMRENPSKLDPDIFILDNTVSGIIDDISDTEPLFWPLTPNSYWKDNRCFNKLQSSDDCYFKAEMQGAKQSTKWSVETPLAGDTVQEQTIATDSMKRTLTTDTINVQESKLSGVLPPPGKHTMSIFSRRKVVSPKRPSLKSTSKGHWDVKHFSSTKKMNKEKSEYSRKLPDPDLIEKLNNSDISEAAIGKDLKSSFNLIGRKNESSIVKGDSIGLKESDECSLLIQQNQSWKNSASLSCIDNNICAIMQSDDINKFSGINDVGYNKDSKVVCKSPSISYMNDRFIPSLEDEAVGSSAKESLNLSNHAICNPNVVTACFEPPERSIEMLVGLSEFDGREGFGALDDKEFDSPGKLLENRIIYLDCEHSVAPSSLFTEVQLKTANTVPNISLSLNVPETLSPFPVKKADFALENQLQGTDKKLSERGHFHSVGHAVDNKGAHGKLELNNDNFTDFDDTKSFQEELRLSGLENLHCSLDWIRGAIQLLIFATWLYQRKKFISFGYDVDDKCYRTENGRNNNSFLKPCCMAVNDCTDLNNNFCKKTAGSRCIHVTRPSNLCRLSCSMGNHNSDDKYAQCTRISNNRCNCYEGNIHDNEEIKNVFVISNSCASTEKNLVPISTVYHMFGRNFFDCSYNSADLMDINTLQAEEFVCVSEGVNFEGMITYFSIKHDELKQILYYKVLQFHNCLSLNGNHNALKKKAQDHVTVCIESEGYHNFNVDSLRSTISSLYKLKEEYQEETSHHQQRNIVMNRMKLSESREYQATSNIYQNSNIVEEQSVWTASTPDYWSGMDDHTEETEAKYNLNTYGMEKKFQALEVELLKVKEQNKKLQKLVKDLLVVTKRLECGIHRRRLFSNSRSLLLHRSISIKRKKTVSAYMV